MMSNEIKKVLYKEKPTAYFKQIEKSIITYHCNTSLGDVYFEVPFSDIGDVPFKLTMEAQLLICWLII